jgi:uncharacterized spore protein YtfJ
MDIQQLLQEAREAVTGRRVYGEPVEREGVTVIPAASVRGGAGGGGGESDDGRGGGSGYGLSARPVGAWIVKDGEVTWKPAIDVGRMILGWQVVALAGVVTLARLRKSKR